MGRNRPGGRFQFAGDVRERAAVGVRLDGGEKGAGDADGDHEVSERFAHGTDVPHRAGPAARWGARARQCSRRGAHVSNGDTPGRPRAFGAVLALVDERERATLPAGPSFGGLLRGDRWCSLCHGVSVGRLTALEGVDHQRPQLANVGLQVAPQLANVGLQAIDPPVDVLEAGVDVVEAGVGRARPNAERGDDRAGRDEHRDPVGPRHAPTLPRWGLEGRTPGS